MRKARITLNQLMDHPQETPFQEEDAGLEMTRYFVGGKEIKDFIEDENTLKIFIDFMVAQSMEYSPEIKALDITIKQQKSTKEESILI